MNQRINAFYVLKVMEEIWIFLNNVDVKMVIMMMVLVNIVKNVRFLVVEYVIQMEIA